MAEKTIVCPYCFANFRDEQVHFRMETIFQKEEDCDPDGMGRTQADIEELGDKALLEKFKLRQNFLARKDDKYENFWYIFGETTEKSSASIDGKHASVMPFNRPVFDPHNEAHKQFFNGDVVENPQRLVVSAQDCFGKTTERRVCPQCHNPLPGTYGKNPVKFISVIGITGAGKTVYLSQLCKNFKTFATKVGVTAVPTSKGAMEFILGNQVAIGEPLPVGSPPENLTQPIFYDLNLKQGDRIITNTVVIYDIAGENCVDAEKMKNFGHFIEQSDGIMLLIDPKQFESTDVATPATDVLDAIYNRFINKEQARVRNMPLAVCISKGDMMAMLIAGKNIEDVEYLKDEQNSPLSLFNAQGYNSLQSRIKAFIDNNACELRGQLKTQSDNYNYFLFSAIGTYTEKIEKDGKQFDAPAAPPIPKRIEEPLYWLFHKLGYIEKNAEISLPEPLKVVTWTCKKGHDGNTGERCSVCDRDRNGKKSGFFSLFASF